MLVGLREDIMKDQTDDIEGLAQKIRALGADIDHARKKFDEYQIDRVTESAVERLGKRFWWLAAIGVIAGFLGVPLSARAFLEADQKELAIALEKAKTQREQVEREAEGARQTIEKLNSVAGKLESELLSIEERASELRGELERSNSESQVRLASLQDQLRVVAEQSQTNVKAKVESIAQKEKTELKAFATRGATAVRIVYNGPLDKKARSFQSMLAKQGYTTQVVSSDFSELKRNLDDKSDTIQVIGHSNDMDPAREVAALLQLHPGVVRQSAKIASGSVQILMFY